MPAADPALVELNRRNEEFWARQRVLMERRMADLAVLESAIEAIASETTRQVPIRNQMSFEKALEDAERDRLRFIGGLARAGGKAEKIDSLQELIVKIVRSNPGIGSKHLLEELRKQERGPVIVEVDKKHIHYRSPANSKKAGAGKSSEQAESIGKKEISGSAPISGLKHRLGLLPVWLTPA